MNSVLSLLPQVCSMGGEWVGGWVASTDRKLGKGSTECAVRATTARRVPLPFGVLGNRGNALSGVELV